MAVYISLEKVSENDDCVVYKYSNDAVNYGHLQLNKATGIIQEIVSYPNDSEKFVFMRASRKIYLCYKKGSYPDRTCWAS